MGVDLITYRERIGLYQPGHKQVLKKERYRSYTTSSSSDIHYRIFATLTVILTCLWCVNLVLSVFNSYINTDENCPLLEDQIIVDSQKIQNLIYGNILPWPVDFGTYSSPFTFWPLFPGIQRKLLLISGDIESNPGPVSDDSETRILEAISALDHRLMRELHDVKSEMLSIKSEVALTKSECIENKKELSKLKRYHSEYEKEVSKLKGEVDFLRETRENLQLDVEYLSDKIDRKMEEFDEIGNDIDYLEHEAKKSNLRIFGLSETNSESIGSLKSKVIKEVLNVASPDESWIPDDLKFVSRKGNKAEGICRMVLVTFRFDDDKFKIFKGRDILRNNGIRISDDLTRRQRQKLNKLKSEGKMGYFYKGQLKLFEKSGKNTKSSQSENENDRIFRVGKRRDVTETRVDIGNLSMRNIQTNMTTENNELTDTESLNEVSYI
ncbi:uncharacterized protein LOC132750692 [Ruditapes philippinarum]|uniref:uncharacterized protein LOC132750692 n=1 Tax=Ruditapes philippinarum TaxID=129788 RepID=UPI00295B3606|nr:uncharacterized protein LOC132750692 [Ruditapes philippinarum]